MSTGGARPPARLRLDWNPLRQVMSGSTWRAAAFLAGYILVAGWLLLAVALPGTVTAAAVADARSSAGPLLSTSNTSRAPAAAQRSPNAPTWQNTSSTRAP